jgi:hypothetical protein
MPIAPALSRKSSSDAPFDSERRASPVADCAAEVTGSDAAVMKCRRRDDSIAIQNLTEQPGRRRGAAAGDGPLTKNIGQDAHAKARCHLKTVRGG